MTNALYGKYREKALGHATADVDWINDNIKVTLVDAADYVLGGNIDVHDVMDTTTVPAAARVAVSGNLASKTSTLGVANAANVTFTAVTGDPSEALIIWKDSGTPATSYLIAYIDTATGLPVTPNGGDITVTWDTGTNKIFKL